MGNSKRGEVTFFVGEGEDREVHSFRFSLNTLCKIEDNLGKPFTVIASDWESGRFSIKELRETVRAALKGGEKMTPEEVGDLIEEYGIEETLEKLMECFDKSALLKMAQEQSDADPQKRGMTGTGTPSSTTPSPPE